MEAETGSSVEDSNLGVEEAAALSRRGPRRRGGRILSVATSGWRDRAGSDDDESRGRFGDASERHEQRRRGSGATTNFEADRSLEHQFGDRMRRRHLEGSDPGGEGRRSAKAGGRRRLGTK